MTDYELNKYSEMDRMLSRGDLSFVGDIINDNIILKSDLKSKIANYIVNSSSNFDCYVFDIFNYNDYIENAGLLQKYYRAFINDGNFNQYDIVEYSIDADELLNYFLEKLKDPNYVIKRIDGDVLNEDWFIRYCIDNKRLDIFNFVDSIDKKYIPDIYRLLDEGKGFFINKDRNDRVPDKKLYDELFIANLKNGYVSSYINNYLDDDDYFVMDKEVINILMDLVKQDKDIHFDSNVSEFDGAALICNYIIDNKKYKYLDFINYVIDYKSLDIDKVNEILEENPNYYKYFIFYPKEYLNSSVITKIIDNNISFLIINLDFAWYKEHKDLFIKNILEKKVLIKNCSVHCFFDLCDRDLLKALIDADIRNLFYFFDALGNVSYFRMYYNENFYYAAREAVSRFYGLNIEHLDRFVKRFGYIYLFYINNENMRNAINLDDDNFDKYMNIFNIDSFNLENAKNIFDSLVQYRFKGVHKDDIDRFARIKMSFSNKDSVTPFSDLRALSCVSIDKIRKIKIKDSKGNLVPLLNDNELELYSKSSYDFLLKVFNELKCGINVDANTNILYYINRQFLKDSRESFRSQYNYEDELNLERKYDKKDLMNARICHYFSNLSDEKLEDAIDSIDASLDYNITDVMSNHDCVKKVITFLISNGKKCNEKDVIVNLKEVKNLLENYVFKNGSKLISVKSLSEKYTIKSELGVPEVDSSFIFDILSNINPYELRDTVFNDDDKTNSLINYMKKYKFIYWGDIFKKALSNSNLELYDYTISSFISKFNEVYTYVNNQRKNDVDIGLAQLINFSNILGSSSSRYSVLLGYENAKLVKLNPPPYDAHTSFDREDASIKDLLGLYKRKYITFKPIDRIIRVNDKAIYVNLGNFTDPINITYGERTKACMRIGGDAESLYRFCFSNNNGFHIRFCDSNNNEFVSRVSGFVNGNSVFLNTLRHSVSDNYSDGDIRLFLKKIADIIIMENDDIDNVFIVPGYAMGGIDSDVKFRENIKTGYDDFYFDLHSDAICLATRADGNNSKYVPLKFNKRKEKYYVLRDKFEIISNKFDMLNRLNKYLLLKDMITNDDYTTYRRTELLSHNIVADINVLIVGEDFIAYLTNDLEIVSDYIEREDYRAVIEMREAVRILNNKKKEYSDERVSRRSN